jgi:hypothetical protein
MNRPVNILPLAHVPAAAALIGGLAVMFAGGLAALGGLSGLDAAVARGMAEALRQPPDAAFPHALPGWGLWAGTAGAALGLAWAMLSVPGAWRRVVLWASTLVVIAAWAPVLALAAHRPVIGAPLVAVAWVGLCVWFYAGKHRLPCEDPESAPRRHRESTIS